MSHHGDITWHTQPIQPKYGRILLLCTTSPPIWLKISFHFCPFWVPFLSLNHNQAVEIIELFFPLSYPSNIGWKWKSFWQLEFQITHQFWKMPQLWGDNFFRQFRSISTHSTVQSQYCRPLQWIIIIFHIIINNLKNFFTQVFFFLYIYTVFSPSRQGPNKKDPLYISSAEIQ